MDQYSRNKLSKEVSTDLSPKKDNTWLFSDDELYPYWMDYVTCRSGYFNSIDELQISKVMTLLHLLKLRQATHIILDNGWY